MAFSKFLDSIGPIKDLKLSDFLGRKLNNIIILSNTSASDDIKYTAGKIKKWCDSNSILCNIVYCDRSFIKKDDGVRINSNNELINLAGSIILPMTGNKRCYTCDFISNISEKINSRFINKKLNDCSFPLLSVYYNTSVNSAKTSPIYQDNIRVSIENVGGKFPVVLINENGGKMIIESLRSLVSISQSMDCHKYIISEFIKCDKIINVFSVNGVPKSAICRQVDDQYSDYMFAKSWAKYNIDNNMKDICEEIYDKEGYDLFNLEISMLNNNIYVTNLTQDIPSINYELIDENVYDNIVTPIIMKNNLKRVYGIEDVVEIDGENVKSTFDTGNKAMPYIYVDKISLNADGVRSIITINGRQINKQVNKSIMLKHGGSNTSVFTSVFSILVNGVGHDVEMAVIEKGETSAVFDRNFIKSSKIILDPAKG